MKTDPILEKRKNMVKIMELSKEMFSSDKYAEIKQKYALTEPDPKFTAARHKLIVGKARNLAMDVISNGGSMEDVALAVMNTMVCIDAMKYKLDWARWKRDNHIDELVKKYSMKK